jgi:hypothetical protein
MLSLCPGNLPSASPWAAIAPPPPPFERHNHDKPPPPPPPPDVLDPELDDEIELDLPLERDPDTGEAPEEPEEKLPDGAPREEEIRRKRDGTDEPLPPPPEKERKPDIDAPQPEPERQPSTRLH